MVNHLNGANTAQAQAIAANEAMASDGSVAKDLDRISDKPKVERSEIMKRLVEVGGNKDITTNLLKDLVTKVSQIGVDIEGIVKPDAKPREQKQKVGKSSFSDSVSLSSESKENEGILAIKQLGNRSADVKKQIQSQWQVIEEQLIKQGKNNQEISMMEQQFKQSQSQKQMMGLLKDAALMYYLDSDSKLDKVIRRRGFANVLKKAGKAMGKEAADQAHEQVRSFVLEELENQLIYKTFKQDQDFRECYRLLKIGDKAGLKTADWVEKVWPGKKEHLGLNLIDVPQEVTGLNVNVKTDTQASRERDKFELEKEDEKDLMISRLRALYMQVALRPNAVNTVKTWFKIWQLKNGMMKLRIFVQDIDDKVKQEAKTLAKIKTMEILEEGLHELATFFDKGPDKDFAEQKVKSCLKNLERLGFRLSDQEFLDLKKRADQHIFEIAKNEYDQIKDKQSKKAEQLQKVVERLEKENENVC